MNASRILRIAAGTVVLAACGESSRPTGTVVDFRQDLTCVAGFDRGEIFAGAARDAIPALTRPAVLGSHAPFMRDTDRVLGVVVNGEPRAYPLGILWWHELVNDLVGGERILVSYCPLTGSGIVFNPTIEGVAREFIVSGLLYRSNLVMLDRESETLWNQMLLGSQCGIDRGRELDRIPVVETDWGDWKERHPNTTVLNLDTGYTDRPYFRYPYGDYADPDNNLVDYLAPGTRWRTDLKTKELVLGVFDGSDAIAYSLERLAASGASHIVSDQIGSTPFVVVSRPAWNTAQALDRRVDGQLLTFTVTNPDPFAMADDQTGSEWNSNGEAVSGPLVGKRLTPVADSYVAFWFAWALYYPAIAVYQ